MTSRRAVWISFAFTMAFLFVGTWSSSLWDADEPRFSEATRVMMATGDYLVPRLNGEFRFDKPVLFYWVQAVGYLLFGIGEMGARFPSVLGLALAAALTARIGSRMFGPKAGLAAGLMLPLTLQAAVIGRAATADGIMLAGGMVAIDALHARMKGSRGFGTWALLYLGLALACLAKGPPGWVAPLGAALGVVHLRRGRFSRREVLGALAGFAVVAALVLAWVIPADRATDGGIFDVSLGHHMIERAGRGFEGHGGYEPWWFLFYLPMLLVFFIPWSAWIPQGWRFWRSKGMAREDRLFVGWWAGITFLIFTASISKLPHYILPMYPALTLVLAGYFTKAVKEGRSLFEGRAGRVTLRIITVMGVLVGVGLPVALPIVGFPISWVPALGASGLLFGLVVALWLLHDRPVPLAQGGLTALAIAGVFVILMLTVLPEINRTRLVPKVGEALARLAPEGVRRTWNDFRPDGLVYYSHRDAGGRLTADHVIVIERLKEWEDVVAYLRTEEPGVVVVSEKKALRMTGGDLSGLPGEVLWRGHGYYAKKGRWEAALILGTRGMR